MRALLACYNTMDRSRVLQQLQESQARLAKAEAELAEAAGKLRAWSEAGNHGPLDTVMGQDIEKAVVPDPHLLAQAEMPFFEVKQSLLAVKIGVDQ